MRMNPLRASQVLEGWGEPVTDPMEVIEASRWIRDHGPRGMLSGNGTRDADDLANLADRDMQAALDHVEQR